MILFKFLICAKFFSRFFFFENLLNHIKNKKAIINISGLSIKMQLRSVISGMSLKPYQHDCCELFSTVWQITMNSYSVEQRVRIITFYYQNQCSVRETFRALRDFYPRHNRPAESTALFNLVAKFELTGSINYQPTPIRQRNARSIENIAAVRDSVRENPRQSISRRSQELGLSATSTWRILRRDLGMHAYKIQLTQELKVNDHT